MFKNNLKNNLGHQLMKFRTQKHIRLVKVAEQTGLSWQKIDSVENRNYKTWDVYEKLLKAYGKQIKIELVDIDR